MIIYLNIIILYYMDQAILQILTLSNNEYIGLFLREQEFDFHKHELNNYYNNLVATGIQMHNLIDNIICFKYVYRKNR